MKENTITKEHQVVCLPTDKASNNCIGKHINTGIIRLMKRMLDGNKVFEVDFNASSSLYQPQHLYFISDKPIKKGDWFYFGEIGGETKFVAQALGFTDNTHIQVKSNNQFGYGDWNKVYCKKIIATSNPDLWVAYRKDNEYITTAIAGVPKIDTTFIEAYVKEQGKIDKVLLEYEKRIELSGVINILVLKLKSNGSVIVHPVKEKMYSREEVKQAIIKFAQKNPLLRGIQVLEHNVNEFIEQHL